LDKDRISGYTDELDAIMQAIYLILSTERYQYIIYSWDYGVELIDLIGQPMPYVMSEIPRRITEALTQDDRIEDVVDFEFEQQGKKLHVTFTVVSIVGNIPTELEVDV
jgi:phage baseplate assembly protein W